MCRYLTEVLYNGVPVFGHGHVLWASSLLDGSLADPHRASPPFVLAPMAPAPVVPSLTHQPRPTCPSTPLFPFSCRP